MRAVELSTLVMSSSLGLHKSGHIRVVIGMLQHRTYLVGRMLLVWFGVVWHPQCVEEVSKALRHSSNSENIY